MQREDRAHIAEFLSRTIGRLTDTRPRTEAELRKGFLISPAGSDNTIKVESRISGQYYAYKMEVLFSINNTEFKTIYKAFWRDKMDGSKLYPTPMIIIDLDNVARGLSSADFPPYAIDEESQHAAYRHIEENGPAVFEWVRSLSSAEGALNHYRLNNPYIASARYPIVMYTLTKIVHGRDAALSYVNLLNASELPPFMRDQVEFLWTTRP